MRPKDTVAVKKAKEEHAALFKMIAKRNQQPAGKVGMSKEKRLILAEFRAYFKQAIIKQKQSKNSIKRS
jgi:hypothetical protein